MKKSPLIPIFLIVAVDVMGFTVIFPILPFYAEIFNATPLLVGLLTSSYALCQFLAGPLLGKISDRVGRKPVLLVSQIGTLTGFLIMATAGSLPLIFLARILDGLTAGNLTVAQAYISDVTEPKHRTKAFGIIGVAFGLGFLIGPAAAGYLSQYDFHYPIYLAGGLSALSILLTALLLPSHPPHAEPDAEQGASGRLSIFQWQHYVKYFRDRSTRRLLVQFLFFSMAFSMFMSGFALFSERRFDSDEHDFGAKQVGYYLAFAGLLGLILQGNLMGPLVKRFGEAKLVKAGFLTAAIGYALLSQVHPLWPLLASFVFMSFGNGVLRPCISGQLSQGVSKSEQGVVIGLTQSLNSLSQIAGPIISGVLIHHKLLPEWALVCAVITFVGLASTRGK